MSRVRYNLSLNTLNMILCYTFIIQACKYPNKITFEKNITSTPSIFKRYSTNVLADNYLAKNYFKNIYPINPLKEIAQMKTSDSRLAIKNSELIFIDKNENIPQETLPNIPIDRSKYLLKTLS